MIDFPLTELMDEAAYHTWLEQHLYPDRFACPHCGSSARRFFRQQRHFDAYRCRACAGYYNVSSG